MQSCNICVQFINFKFYMTRIIQLAHDINKLGYNNTMKNILKFIIIEIK